MKRCNFALAAFVLLASSVPSQAAAKPGTIQFLYDTCKDDLDSRVPGFCLGYLLAVGQIMAKNANERSKILPADAEGKKYLFEQGLCPNPSSDASGQALIQAFLTWVDKHPKREADTAIDGATASLAEAWPCSTQN